MTRSREMTLTICRSVLLALVLACGTTDELAATLIIAYRSAGEVVIAADSLRTIRSVPSGQILACKIRNFGDVVFAATGDTTLPEDGFALATIPAPLDPRNHPATTSLSDRIGMFDSATVAAYTRLHQERTSARAVSFTYILGYAAEGRPTALSRTFTSVNGVLEIGDRSELPQGELLFAGQPEVLDALAAGGFPDAAGPIDSVPSLLARVIAYQASRSPTVSGPVDIIRVTVNGAEWLRRKPHCPERE